MVGERADSPDYGVIDPEAHFDERKREAIEAY